MRRIFLLLALVASLFATPAFADFTGKNAGGSVITFKNSGDCTSVVCVPQFQPIDSTGAAFGVTANPFFMTIGSGKVVSGAYASGAFALGSVASGAMVDLGAQADAVCGTATGTCSLIALQKYNNATSPVLGAGSAIIGKVGIDQTTPGTTNGVQVNAALPAGTNTIGTVGQLTYPVGATAITASATGTTAATTATLAAAVAKTTYICGYSIRANATAAATVTNTITGVITATLSSIMWVAPLASGIGVDEQIFSPCIPSSGTNTAIAVVSGAPGAGGTVSSRAWGYQL